jgi:hypothetical protein
MLLDTMPPVYFKIVRPPGGIKPGETLVNILEELRQDVLAEIRNLFWSNVPERKKYNKDTGT